MNAPQSSGSPPPRSTRAGRPAVGGTLLVGALVIAYVLLQPYLEKKLGMRLPALTGDGQQPAATADAGPSPQPGKLPADGVPPEVAAGGVRVKGASQPGGRRAKGPRPAQAASKTEPPRDPPNDRQRAGTGKDRGGERKPEAAAQPGTAQSGTAQPGTAQPGGGDPSSATKSKLGELRKLAGGELISTAGLRYTRGSAEGHRLLHVLRHGKDDPDRPVHGVFEGTQQEIVALIDEAYLKTKGNNRDVKRSRERDRTVYTIAMGRRIGYLGGQVGRRKRNPPLRHIRLVLEGNRVITAYPLTP